MASLTVKILFVGVLLQPRWSSSVHGSTMIKCDDFREEKILFKNMEAASSEGNGRSDFISIPAHLMSHFESATFRLVADPSFACDKNYEVIKISLIGSDTININLTTSRPDLLDPDDVQTDAGQMRSATSTGKVYEPFHEAGNSSYFEGFMYAIENITSISDSTVPTSTDDYEEHQCERKLSRQETHFTPLALFHYFGDYYRPSEYCIQRFNETGGWMMMKKCKVDCNDDITPCIPLCCHMHEYVDLAVPCCQATLEATRLFEPVIYEEINRRVFHKDEIDSNRSIGTTTISDSRALSTSPEVYNMSQIKPHYVSFKYHHACPDGLEPERLYFKENGESVLNTRVHIQRNGKIAYIGDDRQWHFLETYCVAGLMNGDTLKDDWEGIETMTNIILYCLDSGDHMPHEARWRYYVYIGVFSFSSVFLMLTVIVYILLWDKHNIHGWTILSFVASEFCLFLFLTISYVLGVFSKGDETSRTAYCVGSGILAHFFFLSTFCWLTIINLDLWWTFKNFTPLSERSKGRKRFCLYMLFAWGIPSLVVGIGLALEHIHKTNLSHIVVPDYGNRDCFLASQARGIYLYHIIGVLLVINFIMISLTFLTIYKFKKSTRVASSSSSKTKERSFKLFAKLVIVMGVTWTLEFVQWVDSHMEKLPWLFLVIDVFNVLQAVATFVIFVCKRKIINQLEQKHPSLRFVTRPILNIVARQPSSMITSTGSKPTRSTVAATSSVVHRSGHRSHQKTPSFAECKL